MEENLNAALFSSFHCPSCGKITEENKKFCPSCGSPLHEDANTLAPPPPCATCGNELQKEDLFCGSCGTRVHPSETSLPTPLPAPPQRETSIETPLSTPSVPQSPLVSSTKRSSFGVLLALGAVALLVVGFFGGKILNRQEHHHLPVAPPDSTPALVLVQKLRGSDKPIQ